MATTQALTHAAAMGRRAGLAYRETGVPVPSPSWTAALPELAKAWEAAYVDAAYPPAEPVAGPPNGV